MKISAKIDYACRALVELGLHWPDREPLQVQTISKHQDIPSNFLTHILISLKQIGLVESVRGKAGGYYLTRSPEDINLKDVLTNFGGKGVLCAETHGGARKHVMDTIWQELDQDILRKIESLTLNKICDRARSHTKVINYEI